MEKKDKKNKDQEPLCSRKAVEIKFETPIKTEQGGEKYHDSLLFYLKRI